MAIRVSGLVSGLDTDSIVQELVAAYSTKKDKHVKAQNKLEWKMDAWKELNKKVNSLYKKLGNMRFSSYYNKKTTSISDSTKATVTASNSAINGTQSLKINEVASTGYVTGGQLKYGTTASTTLGELGLNPGDTGKIAVKTKNGTKNIDVSADMKISDFVNKLKDAGVSASYDSTYNRLYISAKDSGVENDFALTAADANGLKALQGLKVYTNSTANQEAYEQWDRFAIDVNGNTKYLMNADGSIALDGNGQKIPNGAFDASNIDANATKANFKQILDKIEQYQGEGTDSIKKLQETNAGLRTDQTNLQADRKYAVAFMDMKGTLAMKTADGSSTKLTGLEQSKLEAMLKKTDDELKADGETARFNELKEKLGLSDEDFKKLRTNANAVKAYEDDPDNADVKKAINDAYDVYVNTGSDADLQQWMSDNADAITDVSNKMKLNDDSIAFMESYIKNNELLTASAPKATLTDEQKAAMSASELAAWEADNSTDARAQRLKDQYDYVQRVKGDSSLYTSDAVRIDGTNASITLNNVDYVSASNNITVNGLTITALQKTGANETLSVTTQADVQGMYDTIKDFLKEYNALIKEMDELYNADSAKGYEPLTDDEKADMTDKEIEKWEEKIKKSLLRRDDTLSSVMNLMTTSMAQGFTLSDGKKYSLASFGIKTQGYLSAAEHEGSVYHIDGDKEDEISSGSTDKLLAALQKDPEMVQEFFQKLSDNLYNNLDKRMKSTTMHSRYSIYNDKQMQRDYDEYTKTIKKWEDKVSSMEEYYYNKFAAMEKALSSLQSSTSALSGLLGS